MTTPRLDAPHDPPEQPSVAPAPTGTVACRVWATPTAQWVVTALAALLVLMVLIGPGRVYQFTPVALIRIPAEGLLGLAVLLALPVRARTLTASALGVALGLWAVVRIIDVGFFIVLDRPFDLVFDWSFLRAALTVAGASTGGTPGAVALAVVAALVLVALVTLSVLRLSRIAVRHRVVCARAVVALGVVWVVCAATGARLVGDTPVAARDYLERLGQVPTSLADASVYAAERAVDPYQAVPGGQLLTALRGKDVLVVLVESYGRVALQDPAIAPTVTAALTDGAQRLAAAGIAARSAYLTAPTSGGGSWLSHATLLSGTWVNNQGRYETIAASDRLTLTGAFRRAGWRTVTLMPGLTSDWPEGQFYGFDEIRGAADLAYAGPRYAYEAIPDQFVLSVFQRTERDPTPRAPVMAVIPLLTSHVPWSPVPELRDWDGIGDGSAFPEPTEPVERAESVFTRDDARVRADYARAIAYSLATLVSYVEKYGGDDLVLVFLGDHQPLFVDEGDPEGRDAPVSIVTRDPVVLDRIAGWGWQEGLVPADAGPVWRMDTFRDHFLDTFR